MPLVTGKDLLVKARAHQYGIGAFNTDNLETTQAIIEAAEEMKSPVMLAITEGAMNHSRKRVVDIALYEANRASVPVAVHLDHGENYEICLQCIRLGFTSVMIDKSHLDEASNIAETKRVVEAAHAVGVSVEAEIGVLSGIEEALNVSADHAQLTKPDEAERFMLATEADSLAIAIGTSHGPNKGIGRPFIDHERIKAIADRVPQPLVMHGASGIAQDLVKRLNEAGGALKNAVGIHDEDSAKAVTEGIAKINVGTDLRLAGMTALREVLKQKPAEIDLRKVLGSGP
ncbi:MAG: class II fructose-bisphosphate aldolase [Deinococcales bacterium]